MTEQEDLQSKAYWVQRALHAERRLLEDGEDWRKRWHEERLERLELRTNLEELRDQSFARRARLAEEIGNEPWM